MDNVWAKPVDGVSAVSSTLIYYDGLITPERSGPFLRYTFTLTKERFLSVPTALALLNVVRVTSEGVTGMLLVKDGATPGVLYYSMREMTLDPEFTEGETIVLLALTAL